MFLFSAEQGMSAAASSTSFEYEGKDLEAMDFAPNYHAWILSSFDRYVGQRLLEVGAGTGAVSRMILERYRKETWLLEPSDMYLQLTRNLESLDRQIPVHPLRGFLDQQLEPLRRQ